MRLALVRPGWQVFISLPFPEKICPVKISDIHLVFQGWLGNFSSRRRLHFWPGHLWDFQPFKRPYTHLQVCLCSLKLKILTKSLQGSPIGDGGVQLVARQERGNDLLRPQLLLPLWEPGCHHGAWRRPQVFLPSVWPCSKARGTSRDSSNAGLLLVIAAQRFSHHRLYNLQLHSTDSVVQSLYSPSTVESHAGYFSFVRMKDIPD